MFKAWQQVLIRWYRKQWGYDFPDDRLIERITLKLTEESGEVAGAIIKGSEPDHPQYNKVDLELEMGQVVVCLLVLAEISGLDLENATRRAIDELPNILEHANAIS